MKSKLIILDADVVIELHTINAWTEFLNNYEVYLTQNVREECQFYPDPSDESKQIPIDLDEDIQNGRVKIEDIEAKEIISINNQLKRYQAPEIEIGELSTIALLYKDHDGDAIICLAEFAAITSAVLLGLAEKCISLEAALIKSGLQKPIRKQFTDKWLLKAKKEAEQRRITFI